MDNIDWKFYGVTLFSWGCSCAMIFGGVVPYIPQYREIYRTENTEGFSLFVCLSLLIANTLRVLFWFGHAYELPLLAQSIIMNITMLAMIHMCIRVRTKNVIIKNKEHLFTDLNSDGDDSTPFNSTRLPHPSSIPKMRSRTIWDFDMRYFWKWTDFLSYIEFLSVFTLLCGVILYIFLEFSPFIEFVGFLSVFMEAMLGVPQFYRNLINKSTMGMSKKMVLMWTCGDVYKTVYFIIKEAPTQFWVCGCLQIFIDIAILIQVLIYRTAPISRPKPISSIH